MEDTRYVVQKMISVYYDMFLMQGDAQLWEWDGCKDNAFVFSSKEAAQKAIDKVGASGALNVFIITAQTNH